MAKPKPTFVAAVLCDQAIQEAGTGKWTLVGTFTQIVHLCQPGKLEEASKLIRHDSMGLYFCLSNAAGEYDATVEICKLDTSITALAELRSKVNLGNEKTNYAEIGMNIKGFIFPGVGRYTFRLFLDGNYIADKHVDVVCQELTQTQKPKKKE